MKKQIYMVAALFILAAANNSADAQSWNTTGNAGTNATTNFIGTTDNVALKIRVNNSVKVTINNSGYMGIGITSPTSRLHVKGSATANSDVFYSQGNYTGNVHVAAIRGTSTPNPGYGYGVAGTGGLMGVYGSVSLSSFAGTAYGVYGYAIGSAGTRIGVYGEAFGGTINWAGYFQGNSYFSGNVGIGTTPSSKLDVLGNTRTTNFQMTGGATNGFILKSDASGNAAWMDPTSLAITETDPKVSSTTANKVPKWNGTTLVDGAIFDNGNVGIGTTSPGEKLTVLSADNNSATNIGAFYSNNLTLGIAIGYDEIRKIATATNSDLKINAKGNGNLILQNSATRNVGIGTSSPNAKLDVAGTIRLNDYKIYLRSGTDAFHSLGFDGTVNGPVLSGFSGGALGGTATTNANVLTWTWDGTNGKVGIGTNSPVYKLDVCGVIRSNEVRVETGWCDYVFADDYALPALTDVEAFIKANKHLPGVTAGSVIESEGLEVGKTSAQMIKKIEELTLYVIDLQKQVDTLKNNNK